jgi:hypothetical protein
MYSRQPLGPSSRMSTRKQGMTGEAAKGAHLVDPCHEGRGPPEV